MCNLPEKNCALVVRGRMLDEKYGVCAARLFNALDPNNKDAYTVGPDKMEANRVTKEFVIYMNPSDFDPFHAAG